MHIRFNVRWIPLGGLLLTCFVILLLNQYYDFKKNIMISAVAFVISLFSKTPVKKLPPYNLPAPVISHVTFNREAIGGRRIFVIGDVHGCLDELKELLRNELILDRAKTLIIYLGDIIGKGPRSIEVLKLVRSTGALVIRGNNEDKALERYYRLQTDPSYALPEKHSWISRLHENDAEFLNSLPYTITIPSLNSVLVHAGLIPGTPLEEHDLYALTNMRNILSLKDGLDFSIYVKEGHPWASVWKGPEHVYFGHDARRRLQIYQNATGLDTGCVYGGELTGMFIDGQKERFSIKAFRVHEEPTG